MGASRKPILFSFLLISILVSCGKRFDSESGPAIPGDISWKTVGPDSIQVTALAVDPGEIIYAAVVNSSQTLLRSMDRGESWTPVSVPQLWTSEYIKAMSIDGTGTIYAALFNGMTAQLECSHDAGTSWGPTGALGDIETIACDDAGIVYVGTISTDESAGSLRISSDKGTTWTHAAISDTVGVYCVAVSKIGTVCALTGLGGVLRSTDRGTSWTKSDSGLPTLPLWAIGASPDGTLYVSFGYSPHGVYRSTNDGTSWTSSGLNNYLVDYLVVDAKNEVFALASYQSPKGLFRSTDKGTSWSGVPKGFGDNDRVLSFAVTPSGYLFVGTSSGLLRSVDPITEAN